MTGFGTDARAALAGNPKADEAQLRLPTTKKVFII
jgi:hypothetical protein